MRQGDRNDMRVGGLAALGFGAVIVARFCSFRAAIA
jgi:hypothetical protein